MTPFTIIILKCIIVWIILLIVLLICSFIEYLVGNNYHRTFIEFCSSDDKPSFFFVIADFLFEYGGASILLLVFVKFAIFLYDLIPL